MIYPRWHILYPPRPPKSAILVLPGRGQHGFYLGDLWSKHAELHHTMIVCITPVGLQWYPLPIGPYDQDEAVSGLEHSRLEIERVLKRMKNEMCIAREKTALVGFSAGGVMALYTAMHSASPLAGVVCHGGAILEPYEVPKCKFLETPFVLTHAHDDNDFDWFERYLPMKSSLQKNSYNLKSFERYSGGHMVFESDIYASAYELSDRLDYSQEWRDKFFSNDDSEQ